MFCSLKLCEKCHWYFHKDYIESVVWTDCKDFENCIRSVVFVEWGHFENNDSSSPNVSPLQLISSMLYVLLVRTRRLSSRLVKFILRLFIYLFLDILLLIVILIHRIVLISFSSKSLLTYRGTIDFYVLIFTSNNLLNSLFSAKGFGDNCFLYLSGKIKYSFGAFVFWPEQ